MKLRATFYVLIVLSILLTLHPITSSAQDSSVYMYWVDISANKIQRANLDGTNIQDILTGLNRPVSLDLDITNGKMYWTDRSTPDLSDPDAMSNIQRANLDGTGIETLVSGGPSIKETIALDTSGGKMYWVDFDGNDNKIQRAALDGSNVEDIVTDLENPRGLALDLSQGKMYWADSGANKIQRANLDGTNIEDIVALLSEPPHYIALDFSGGKIYWTEHVDGGKIQRANLDGSNLEAVVSGLSRPFGIALDSLNGKIYWTDPIADKIQRANLDGSNVEDLITTGLVDPLGIALGIPQMSGGLRFSPNVIADQTFTVGTAVSLTLPVAAGGTPPYDYSCTALPTGLYFDPIVDGPGYIGGTPTTAVDATPVTYTATDATGASASLTFTITVQDALSPRDVYMYWADFDTNKIQRANLDGTNVQDLVPGFGRPVGIALDISGGKMYFTDRNAPDLRTPGAINSIHRANLDGTNLETILPGSDPVKEAIALDISRGKMYWAEYDGVNEDHKIRRANLDGTNVEDLITEFALGADPVYEGPRGIALDLSMRKIYWTNLAAGKIQRANLNGTNVEDLITGLTLPHHIALDFSGGKIYWSDHLDGKIQRANFNGTNVEDLVGGLTNPAGIALDVARGKMYWTDAGAGQIQRANLDGSNVEGLVSGLGRPTGLALGIPEPTGPVIPNNAPVFTEGDSTTRTVAENTPSGTPIGAPISATDVDEDTLTYTLGGTDAAAFSIERMTGQLHTLAPLDYDTQAAYSVTVAVSDGNGGSDTITVTIHVTDSTDPPVLGVYMYWADTGANKIQRANLDGSNVQDLVPAGSGRPVGIALDLAGGKMYWTDRDKADETDPTGRSSIQRANLDGSNVETLVLGGNSVKEYIALDISGGKMYWSEWIHPAIGADSRIRRANLDGSNIEDIVLRIDSIRGLTLDISQPKIYWGTLDKLRSANLDGSNIQDVLTVDDPHGIALDITGSKIYWANPNQTTQTPGRIRRANFDGSNIEDIVVGLGAPYGITLDISNNKMYWTDPGRNKIQRANLDGTNVEDVVTGLRSPIGIALGIPQILSGLRFDPNMIADQTFTVGTDVSLTLPVATGGTEPYDYTLSPDPPAGLQFDARDRWIGGTPTTPRQTTPYTYTATDANGSTASLAFTITVTAVSALENGLFAEVYRPGNALTQLPDFQTLTPVQTFTITHLDIPERPCAQGFPGLGIDVIENFAIRFHGQLNIATAGTYNFALSSDDGSRLYINGRLIIDHDGLATPARGNPGRGSVALTAGMHDVEIQYFQGPCSHIRLRWFWQPPGGTEQIVPADVLYLPDTPPGSRISFSPSMIANQTFTVGTSVHLNLPTATGGSAPYTYTLSPIPAGLVFNAASRSLTGTATTVGTTHATYAATDATGVSAALIFTITVEADGLNLDVNGDGRVDVLDLVQVALFYGKRGNNLPEDVNADGVINVPDLVAVANGIDAADDLSLVVEQTLLLALAEAAAFEAIAEAPTRVGRHQHALSLRLTYDNVAAALSDAKSLASRDVRLSKWIPLLEELLQVLAEIAAIPETSALLPNYPNPFNPETWIPYHLAQDAEVILTIYDVRGSVVRALTLGYQPAGVYQSKHRAAYWDGRNDAGEKVSSGVYFYTLTAGEFTATRKLLIIK